jgi:hypothetical protein
MRLLRPALLLLCLFTASLSHAACESGLAERMHAKLHPNRPLDERLAACKIWPAFPGRSIVVLPMPRETSDKGAKVFDLEVLLIQRCPAAACLPISSELTSASKRCENSLSISATTPPSSEPSKWRSIRLTTSSTSRSRCTCMMAAGVGPTNSMMKSSRDSASGGSSSSSKSES